MHSLYFYTVRLRCSSAQTPMQRYFPLHWSQLINFFALKAVSFTPYTFTPPFEPFTLSRHCSLFIHVTLAPVSSSGLVMHGFFYSRPATSCKACLCFLLSTSDSYTLVDRSPLTRSTCPNHFKPFRFTLSLLFSLAQTVRLASAFVQLSIKRLGEGLKTFGALQVVRNVRSVGLSVKREVYERVQVPTVTYVADTWDGGKDGDASQRLWKCVCGVVWINGRMRK